MQNQKTNLNCHQNNPSKDIFNLWKRMVYQETGAKRPEQAEKQKTPEKGINWQDPNFDNVTFSQEKNELFKNNIQETLKNLISKLNIDEQAKEALIKEFNTGLIQQIQNNRLAIADAVKKKGFNALSNDNTTNEQIWFTRVLTALDCKSIGLVYDNTTDTTRFKFYGENGEIQFPNTNIKIQYTPAQLQESGQRQKVNIEKIQNFKITAKEDSTSVTSSSAIESLIGRSPKQGDRVIITRGISEIKATYNQESKKFITEANRPLWLIGGDKLTFYPASYLESTTQVERNVDRVKINEEFYNVLTQIDTNATYLQIAAAILKYQTGKGAVFDGQQILNDDLSAQIVRTSISIPEYANLLKLAHESIGKTKRLPIIMPNVKQERIFERRKGQEQKESQKRYKIHEKVNETLLSNMNNLSLKQIRQALSKKRQSEISIITSQFERQLARTKPLNKKYNVLLDLLSNLDDDYSSDGLKWSITPALEDIMRGGPNGIAWRELWNQENPHIKRVLTVISSYPEIFQVNDVNKIRNIIYQLIITGSSSTFESEDIIQHFGIKLPDGQSYDKILGLAAAPDVNDPWLKIKQEEYRKYIFAIEGLGNAIALIKSENTKFNKSQKLHEQLPKDAEKGAQNLLRLVNLLNIDASQKIIKQKDGSFYAIVRKNNKDLGIRLQDYSTSTHISVHDPYTGQSIWNTVDQWVFEPEDYVSKINSLFETRVNSQAALKPGESIETIKIGKAPTYYQIAGLEGLSQNTIPGVPASKFLSIKKEKGAEMVDNDLAQKTRDILKLLQVTGTATIVDTPSNRKNLLENDEVNLNIRYKGRDFTLKIENNVASWAVYMIPGFNQDSNNENNLIIKFIAKTLNAKEVVSSINKNITRPKFENTNRLKIAPKSNTDKIGVLTTPLNDLNKQLQEYVKLNGYQASLQLNVPQLIEVVFRTHTFEELKKMNCIKQVEGSKHNFLLTSLPDTFKDVKSNTALLRLIYAVKYGTESQDLYVSSYLRESRESIKVNERFKRNLQEIFGYGLSDTDREGNKTSTLDLSDGDSAGGTLATGHYTKDIYFNRTSGKAAYNNILTQVIERNEQGEEVINIEKANTLLNKLFQKGFKRLQLLARTEEHYRNILKMVDPNRKVDIRLGTSGAEKEVLRLGYLSDVEDQERGQTEDLELFKDKLVEQILTLIPGEVKGPNGEIIKKSAIESSLKTLPISVLLNYSYNSDKTHNVGVNLPITLDILGTPNAHMVLVPGFGGKKLGGNGEAAEFRLAIGISFTSADPNKDQSVTFFGGASFGVGFDTRGQFSLGPAAGIGTEFRVSKANEIDNYNHYLNIKAGVGFDITEGQFGLSLGPAYRWEIEAQKRYDKDLNEYLAKNKVKSYIEELKTIYEQGSKPQDISKFVSKLKLDTNLAKQLGIDTNSQETEVLASFEQYIAILIDKFNQNFDLPTIMGGEIGINVVSGVIIASGAVTGNLPIVIGGVVGWGIQFLASLKFNIGSRMVIERQRRTSEREMGEFHEMQKQKQFDKLFQTFQQQDRTQISTSGETLYLDETGQKRNEFGVTSTIAELEVNQIGSKIDSLNKILIEKQINFRLQKTSDNRIEIVLLSTSLDVNEKILISPEIAVVEGNRVFLKDPNNINYLYIDKQTRKYPVETSHGATMESITTISTNRYFTSDTFPVETTITRFNDNKENPQISGKKGKAEVLIDRTQEFEETVLAQERLRSALNKTLDEEKIRPNLIEEHAKKLFKYKNKKGQTFISLTESKAKENLEDPNLTFEELYSFYDDYAKANNFQEPLNGLEKHILTLELSTLRYQELSQGGAVERAKAYKNRLKWAETTITPYFEKRLQELARFGQTIPFTAKELAHKAVGDLEHLDTNQPPTQLLEGTSIAVAIGRGANGLHQMIDGSLRSTEASNKYGYIIGKNYTEALRSGQPPEDHAIAMILLGQLSHLPERSNLKGFMDSNLARIVASNPGLAFIIGLEEYNEVAKFYESGSGDASKLARFMDIVEAIRKAQLEGKDAISVKGKNGVNFMLRAETIIQSGVFNKCANFTGTLYEKVTMIQPSKEEVALLLASSSDSITTISEKVYKEFIGLLGGVTGAVSLSTPSSDTPPGGKPEKPEGGETPESFQIAGGVKLPPTTEGTPQAPIDTPTGPGDNDI